MAEISALGTAIANQENPVKIPRANKRRRVEIAGKDDVNTKESDRSFQMNAFGRRGI